MKPKNAETFLMETLTKEAEAYVIIIEFIDVRLTKEHEMRVSCPKATRRWSKNELFNGRKSKEMIVKLEFSEILKVMLPLIWNETRFERTDGLNSMFLNKFNENFML